MPRVTIWAYPILAMAVCGFSCKVGDNGAQLGGPGESCTKAADCESGLKCISLVCQRDADKCPDDMACLGLECGPDPVCGTSCGTCSGDQSCSDGACVEYGSSCDGNEWESDGCEGCGGECGSGRTCVDGSCSGPVSGGTWTDPNSGLTWENPARNDYMCLAKAREYCATLELEGTGWRLPTIVELRSLIRGCPATEPGGSCNFDEMNCLALSCRDDSCMGCSPYEGPSEGCYWPDAMEGSCSRYWSSSATNDTSYSGWGVSYHWGSVNAGGEAPCWNLPHMYSNYVRCVR